MGGMGGYVKGKTKLATYKNFLAKVNRKRIEEDTGLFMDAGVGSKAELYGQMTKDPETDGWVLYYHFGK